MSKRALTNWIPYDKGLTMKEEVLTIAAKTGLNQWEVAGRLMDFWSFLDSNYVPVFVPNEGGQMSLKKITIVPLLSSMLSQEIVNCMIEVGWLVEVGELYTIPNADRFLGESAKKRLKAAEKKRNQRNGKFEPPNESPDESLNCPEDVPFEAGQKGGLEKEKEKEKEVIRKNIYKKENNHPSTIDEVIQYFINKGMDTSQAEIQAGAFNEYYDPEQTGRYRDKNGKLVSSWKRHAATWFANWKSKPSNGHNRQIDAKTGREKISL